MTKPPVPAADEPSGAQVPVSEWIPDDPELTDVAYWGGKPVPEYAAAGDPADARAERRRRRLLGGHDADVSSPLGEEALDIGRAGRALDGLMEQFAGTADTGERFALWQQMVDAARQGQGREGPAEPPRAGQPPEQPPAPDPPG